MTANIVQKKTKMIPPDGGWGWVVLMSALVVNFLIPGTVKSFGVLFVEFLHVFKASSTAASWMAALCYFLYNSLGPLSSMLSTKYSYKTVTLIGGAFASCGMMLSYFANSVSYLYVSYGLMVGIGAGLTFPPTVYIVTDYFERLRGFANGLCISGSAIGTIVLPPFLQYLLDSFGYRGAVLIMGAITLNTLVCGLLYHPVELHMIEVPVEEGIDNEALTLDEPVINEKQRAIEPASKLPLGFEDTTTFTHDDEKTKQLQNLSELLDNKVLNSSVENEENKETTETEENTSKENVTEHSSAEEDQQDEQKNLEDKTDSSSEEKTETSPETDDTIPEKTNELAEPNKNATNDEKTIEKEPTNELTPRSSRRGSVISTTLAKSEPKILHLTPRLRTNSEKDTVKVVDKPGKTDQKTRESKTSLANSPGPKKEKIKFSARFFDLSVLKDPTYLVILISNSTSAISNTNFMILLPSYAISQGFDKNLSALLLSVVSALDLVGRIGGASLSDIDFVPKYYYFVGGLGMSGIALALLPMANTYAMLAFFCALFGLSSGMYIGITTVILADMLGTEKLSSSYGISLFVNGVLQLVGPPVCGVIFENVGSYKPIFLAFGIILILGTALWAVVPLINRANRKKLEAV